MNHRGSAATKDGGGWSAMFDTATTTTTPRCSIWHRPGSRRSTRATRSRRSASFRPANRRPTARSSIASQLPAGSADTGGVSALAIAVALPGLAIGSFLNVVAARVPLRRSLAHPPRRVWMRPPDRSSRQYPLVSWLVLRGRCRHCDARISIRYPAVEFVTALLVVGCFVPSARPRTPFCIRVLRRARRALGDRRRVPDRPEPDRPARSRDLPGRLDRPAAERRVGDSRARGVRISLRGCDRLPERHGHG